MADYKFLLATSRMVFEDDGIKMFFLNFYGNNNGYNLAASIDSEESAEKLVSSKTVFTDSEVLKQTTNLSTSDIEEVAKKVGVSFGLMELDELKTHLLEGLKKRKRR